MCDEGVSAGTQITRRAESRGQAGVGGVLLTFNMIRPITELQGEDVIDRSAAVQRIGAPVVADEAVLSSQDQHGTVNQFQSELFVLA